ncbi:DUF6777 domain-containing protein [Streptomyces sp. NPDC048506]|uniref:DUF6777 domain-containing protein n=1 Tax=Streptomyces sp. NPDC048506 TaxID=3155028 RepID=UPI00344A1960
MTAPPPPDSHPTGPPTGPLAGPPSGAPSGGPSREPTQVDTGPRRRTKPTHQGPPGPPSGPGDGGGGGGGGGGGEGGGGPWWRSVPRIAIIAAAVVVAVVLTLVLTRPGGSGSTELFAEPAGSTGQNPVTDSSANDSTAAPSATPKRPSRGSNSTFSGATAGLYGGTQNSASCDVEKQIRFLQRNPAKNAAFAGVLGMKPGEVPAYLRSLTSVQLAYDTRITNHGYKDGKAYAFQSVLQAGSAVMVDSWGVPRVRCKCGNPLTKPQMLKQWQQRGQTWHGYQPSNAVVVEPAKAPVKEFVLRNPKTGAWFKRPKGDTGPTHDQPTAPPADTPSGPPSSQPPPYGSTPPGETPTGPSGTSPSGPGTSETAGTTGSGTPPETTGGTSTTGGPTETTGGTTPGGESSTGGGTSTGGSTGGGTTTGGESAATGGTSTGGGTTTGGGTSAPGY